MTNDQEELIEIMNSDPLLVLKIPDLLEAGDWDIDQTIPFLYVKTNQLVRNHPQTDSSSIVGIHPSGFIDRYISGFPNYFPIVLKKSQDYFLIDRQFNLSNGVNLLHYHIFDPNLLSIDDISNYPVSIGGNQFYIVYINDLISATNISSNKIQEPFTVESCNKTCKFECIPDKERKLTTSQLIIDNQNSNALTYIYTSIYRAGSHLILEDNTVFMIITQQSDEFVTKEWERNIIGSFRVEDLFKVEKQFTICYQEYSISENIHALPEINISVDVIDITPVHLNNLVLASDIVENDLLRFASIRIKLDMLVKQNEVLDGNQLLVTEYFQDNVTNYDLFCINIENALGFNSMAIICDF